MNFSDHQFNETIAMLDEINTQRTQVTSSNPELELKKSKKV